MRGRLSQTRQSAQADAAKGGFKEHGAADRLCREPAITNTFQQPIGAVVSSNVLASRSASWAPNSRATIAPSLGT
jgi:hypothetical protein